MSRALIALRRYLRNSLISILKPRLTQIECALLQLECRLPTLPVFIQVGANDGVINDPFVSIIRDWAGLLIEPQYDVYQKLRKNREVMSRVICENAAVAGTSGEQYLYRLSFSNERWATGLSSLDRTTLEKHIESGYVQKLAASNSVKLPMEKNTWIESIGVKTVPLEELMISHQFLKVNALLIDAEGWDFEILKLFPWHICLPQLVIYEQLHLSLPLQSECSNYLRDKGYGLLISDKNVIAILGSKQI